MLKNQIKFKRKLRGYDKYANVAIPIELLEFIEAKPNSKLVLTGDIGKHGKFLALYTEESIEENNDTKPATEE